LKSRGRLYQPVAAAKLFEYLREYAFKIDGVNKLELDSFIALDYVCSIKNTVFPEFLNNSDVKALDVRILFEQIPEFVWKKEYRKRFMVLEGSFPDKKEGKITAVENRMIVDTENIDPITQRASAIPYSIFTQD
jgi:hypothetical protein